MSHFEFIGLLTIWLVGLLFITILIISEFQRVRFSFNIFFSLLFLMTFFFGFPLSALLVFFFDITTAPPEILMQALLSSICFYVIYYLSYKTRLCLKKGTLCHQEFFTMNRVETHLTWIILMSISLASATIFYIQNGFLLFKIHSYSQIFSTEVSIVSMKRFFYFFIPATLVIYFLRQDNKAWFFFMISGVVFGLFTYAIVGGTRANIAVSFIIFLFIGLIRRSISQQMLVLFGVLGIIGMFGLALKRYKLNITDKTSLFYTFLYLTRDTFSPWENLALLLKNYDKIKFQGMMPIIRDFYVFIPSWIWPDRPDLVLNTANYFTWRILNNHSGLTISPTLIGSFIIMGGVWFVFIGSLVVGLIIKWFDWIYLREEGKKLHRYKTAILHSFCFGEIFNIIVLVREGLDSFISRMLFFATVFVVSLIVAKLLYCLFKQAGLINRRSSRIVIKTISQV